MCTPLILLTPIPIPVWSAYITIFDLVKNTVRWLLFVVCTDRKKKTFGHDWEAYFDILDRAKNEELSYHRKLELYEDLADLHYSTREFFSIFYEQALGPKFEQACYDFFASNEFQEIIEEEVSRYFKIPAEILTNRAIQETTQHMA